MNQTRPERAKSLVGEGTERIALTGRLNSPNIASQLRERVMRVTMSTALIIVALFLTTVSTVAGFMVALGGYLAPIASPALLGATGGIEGIITISSALLACSPTAAPPWPPYYHNFDILVTPLSGPYQMIPVNWSLENGCAAYGTFKVQLNPGVYFLILARCASPHVGGPNCPAVPKTTIVESGAWTHVEISMSTGIE